MDREQIYHASIVHFLEPIRDYLSDPNVTEIMVNGPNSIYVEIAGKLQKTARAFRNEKTLLAAVKNIAEYVGRPLGARNPAMDGRLPDGSRVHIMLPPISRVGIVLTIRRFRDKAFTFPELIEMGSVPAEAAELLLEGLRDHKNIVVAGGTGTGKTSLLNALSREIDSTERIVVIEESSELKLVQPHTIYLEARPDESDEKSPPVTIRDLFVNALRMRPDRILIGEVRRGEALEMVQAMLSGHSGSLSTLHASSPQAAATRLETLCLMNSAQLPVYVARAQVAAAIDYFVQTARLADGSRCITDISRLVGLDHQHEYRWENLFSRN